MLILYNIFHLIAVVPLFPLLVGIVFFKAKYRDHLPRRMGWGLPKIASAAARPKVLWVHALSVGEVTSALPLLAGIRQRFADVTVIFSSSTRSGYRLARQHAAPFCDRVIAFPVDLWPVCRFFQNRIRPDAFILVETDFWPNFLAQLHKRNIPAVLVNGRISPRSMKRYQRMRFFFAKMFATLRIVCAQSQADRRKFIELGCSPESVHTLGNLKYEAARPASTSLEPPFAQQEHCQFMVAGSTHPGEEAILLKAFEELRKRRNSLRLLIAPRDIGRGPEIVQLAHTYNLSARLRSSGGALSEDVYIIDTLGELMAFYALGDICFVGGSLVAAGGHNPLEPASLGKPTIFGSDMTDFQEICEELLAQNGAFQVGDLDGLIVIAAALLDDEEHRRHCGQAAKEYVSSRNDIIERHLELLRDIL